LTLEQLQELRAQLAPFDEVARPPPGMQEFCRCYGIDFIDGHPALDYRAGCVQSGEHSLAVHYWRQDGARANLLLVHGYFDHTGLFGKLVEWALSKHCNVLIFDLPGHGLSSGEPGVIDDLGDYSEAIADVLAAVELPRLPLWVMAQSTGCAALVSFARTHDWPFAATVLLAPLVRPAAWQGVRLAQLLLRPFIDSVPRSFSVNTSDGKFLAVLKNDPLQSRQISLRWVAALRRWLSGLEQRDLGVGPALVVQGDADATVDWRYNVDVMRKLFPGSQVEYLPGAGHQLANESRKNRRQYLSRVENWLAENGIMLEESSGIETR
jgi:alpha-beta hydrolase superfamily lysophospholipase